MNALGPGTGRKWKSAPPDLGCSSRAPRKAFVRCRERIYQIIMVCVGLVGIPAVQAAESVTAPLAETRPDPVVVELRGNVVCLAEEMNRSYQAGLPTGHQHIYGLKTEDGKYYLLLRTKFSESIFADERVRAKKLLLKGRAFPNSQVVEAFSLYSIKDGEVCDLYYYCAICVIQTVAPGPCDCCRGETELVERPLRGGR
jgi:hypothetical protein